MLFPGRKGETDMLRRYVEQLNQLPLSLALGAFEHNSSVQRRDSERLQSCRMERQSRKLSSEEPNQVLNG